MAVIDLGRVGPAGDNSVGASRPGPLRRSPRRRWLVTVVAVCCGLAVTGSARPDPRGLTPLWDVPFTLDANSYQLVGDGIVVLDRPTGRLTAHDARTGAVRWSAQADDADGLAGARDGVLLIRAGVTVTNKVVPEGSPFAREFTRNTTAVDAATGRTLWRQPGETVTVVDDHALLLEWDENGERARRIRLVRLRDGGTIWSRDGGGAASLAIDMTSGVRAGRVLAVTVRGRAKVIAMTDGSVVTSGTLPRPGVARSEDSFSVTLHGGQLYQDRTVRGRTTITAYEIDTLRQLWSLEQPSGGSFGCGPVVCVSDGESISGHDRATGARLWRLSAVAGVYPLTGGLLLTEQENGARHTVLEATTGRRLGELGRGLPVWDSRGHLTYLIAGTRQPPGRTSVSSVDPASAEVVLRGTVASAQSCRTEGDLLICVTEDNRLAVTDLG
ncbi:outer membrane protein assembly factor BamB family protein [Actinoplanes awajinensis]|uniref:Pyrrolo-quinoline quinone repeat domain-containing protein n=1 Tax=Actinoplanes awajinensis subsp. mycoplanecinus TaxID=135947 RepID=A0A0X3VB54_9ACTN|nr:PQQ-binding-like beta-propeller repeat protein [Actinoplanes awajinensis]KUL41657.1 hypothetical protein ADL15_03350 [Actinoplanes awajinensis subsp. mycoplanecinus]